jgi:hypothetical protein
MLLTTICLQDCDKDIDLTSRVQITHYDRFKGLPNCRCRFHCFPANTNCKYKLYINNVPQSMRQTVTNLSPARCLFRSLVLKGAALYSTLTIALSCCLFDRRDTSRGPYTTASTLVAPCSRYAEPSALPNTPSLHRSRRTSSARLPSFLRPRFIAKKA